MFLVEKILSVIAPHYCIGCGSEGTVLCAWCLPDSVIPLPERCFGCQLLSANSKLCVGCRRNRRLKHVWVGSRYEGRPKELIHKLKFERMQAAADPIAQLMHETLPFLPPETIITHIPTASTRVRRRGYDQAHLIARSLAARTGLSHDTLLARTTQTRQVGMGRAERLKQMQEAFRFVGRSPGRDTPVLLVDDLTTTGATLGAAAACLHAAGFTTIDAVVFAQK